MAYIDGDKLSEAMYHEAFEKDSDFQKWDGGCWIRYKLFENVLKSIPNADVVGRSVYDQVRWERDTAIEQLRSIGKRFGEAMDDVGKVVRCKDCKHFQCRHWCGSCDPTDFCSHGERKESE